MNRVTSRISYKDLIESGREGTQIKSILKLLELLQYWLKNFLIWFINIKIKFKVE